MSYKLPALIFFMVLTFALVSCTNAKTPDAARLTLEPTKISGPTKTPKSTITPQPTKTSQELQLLDRIRSLMAAMELEDTKDVEVTSVHYKDGSQGPRSILLIEVKYNATPFDYNIVGVILGTVAALATQEGNFESGLVGLNITMFDANLTSRQIVAVKWQDIIDWAAGNITDEQLYGRLIISP